MLLAVLACASSPPVEAPAPAAPPQPPPSDGFAAPERIVAVGDLHGDLEASKAVFQLAGLIDETGHWSGGKAWLVQTGDTVDRGPDSKGVLALLRTLEQEAAAAGGRVLPLLGNHEVMNMTGDWRYVNPEDLQGYGGEAARKAAFTESGEDGRWLRTHDTTVRVGSTVFVHGGIDERWSRLGTRGINAGVQIGRAHV